MFMKEDNSKTAINVEHNYGAVKFSVIEEERHRDLDI
jgi:hypothetical protein